MDESATQTNTIIIVPPIDVFWKPLVSVILEGFNETRDLGVATDTVDALRHQDYPLSQVELILVGNRHQTEHWKKALAEEEAFHSVKAVRADGLHYFQLKNRGAAIATGEILAMTDSDCLPHSTWLGAIDETIQSGADCCVGPSLFREPGGMTSDNIFLRIAASINWGWILGPKGPDGYQARGFMDHNVAFRTSVFRENMMYREDLGRIVAPQLLFYHLQQNGNHVRASRLQRSEHQFTWWYFLVSLQFRYGHEVYRLRREDEAYPNRWIMKASIFEPLVTLGWHVMLDLPRWFRHSNLLDMHPVKQWLALPLVVTVSLFGRCFEAAGMYATIFWPRATRRWAENV